MSSTWGRALKISLFGESHGEAIGMTIDGLPSGLPIQKDRIQEAMRRRRPESVPVTARREKDEVRIVSGVFQGYTTGTPLTFFIENSDVVSSAYSKGRIRPSHADLPAHEKYRGFEDYRGGGHFSGRITAPLVVLGEICKMMLERKGVCIFSHIAQILSHHDDSFDPERMAEQCALLNRMDFPVLNGAVGENMIAEIERARASMDSLGGMIETVVCGMPVGIGEPFFDSVESVLSSLLFSIGGVKSVSFGDGVEFASARGSEVNDGLRYENGSIRYQSNHNGGILGGLTTGEQILIRTVIKPTPSIGLRQDSIDTESKTNTDLNITGRHDPCIVPRARIVIEALTAYGLTELMMREQGRVWGE